MQEMDENVGSEANSASLRHTARSSTAGHFVPARDDASRRSVPPQRDEEGSIADSAATPVSATRPHLPAFQRLMRVMQRLESQSSVLHDTPAMTGV